MLYIFVALLVFILLSSSFGGFIEEGIRHYKVSDLPAEELIYIKPFAPIPYDGAIGVPIDEILGWSCYGPDSSSLTYNIYFGTNRNPPLVKSNHKSTSYDPGTLKPYTTYYWQIVVKDGGYTVKGDVWHFKTEKKLVNGSVSKDEERKGTCKEEGGSSGGLRYGDSYYVVVPDRGGYPDVIICYAVFDPYLLGLKRQTAVDSIRDDYLMYIADDSLKPLPLSRKYREEIFNAELRAILKADNLISIPSVSPDAEILEYSTEPSVNIKFYKDGADNFYVKSEASGEVTLRFKMTADSDYFSGYIPEHLTLDDIPQEILHKPPKKVQDKAQIIIKRIGLEDERNLKTITNKLTDYFSTFGCGIIPSKSVEPDIYLAIAKYKQGACRHRAFAFFVTANSIGLPTRYVVNECHAFVEVFVPTQGWERVNLGGCGSWENRNTEGKKPHEPKTTPAPSVATPPTNKLKTKISIMESPENVYRNEPFTVTGIVTTLKNEGVEDIKVNIYANRTKEEDGTFVGTAITDPSGGYVAGCKLPKDVELRTYHLVAIALENSNYLGSKSDPLIDVNAKTTLDLDLKYDEKLEISGKLLDDLEQLISSMRIDIKIDDVEVSTWTDEKGQFNISRSVSVGNHTVVAEFAGTGKYGSSNASKRISISKEGAITETIISPPTKSEVSASDVLMQYWFSIVISVCAVVVILVFLLIAVPKLKNKIQKKARGDFDVPDKTLNPRAYIIECYKRMVLALRRKGYIKSKNQTPYEYANNINIEEGGKGDIQTLTERFVEARYSKRKLTDEHKGIVGRALNGLLNIFKKRSKKWQEILKRT